MVAFPPFFSSLFWEGYHAASWTHFLRHYRKGEKEVDDDADSSGGLYTKVMSALADPTREAILLLLLKNNSGLSFTRIKDKLKIQNNGTLGYHLNTLQRACLVERTADFSEP
jgi:hypothetical protein